METTGHFHVPRGTEVVIKVVNEIVQVIYNNRIKIELDHWQHVPVSSMLSL